MSRPAAFALAILVAGCGAARATRPFAERIVRDATLGQVTQGTHHVFLNASVAELPPDCVQLSSRLYRCELAGGPPGVSVALSAAGTVNRVALWGQAGESRFTCRLFRALERDFLELVGPPTESWKSCDTCTEWGCNQEGGAHREWKLGENILVLSEGSNLEALTAPDGTPIGEVVVSVRTE